MYIQGLVGYLHIVFCAANPRTNPGIVIFFDGSTAPSVGCTLHCLALPGGKPTKEDNYLRAKAKPQPQPKAWQGASSSTDDTGWHIAQRRKKKEKKKDK